MGHTVHIQNDMLPKLVDELDDVEHEFNKQKTGPWGTAFKSGWNKASNNQQAHAVSREFHEMQTWSPEYKKLEHSVQDLEEAIERNVKITDHPSPHVASPTFFF